MSELITLLEGVCWACGRELRPSDIDDFKCHTDGTTDDLLYCPTHVPSHLTLCLECCGVYTVNLGGICRYCLESITNGEQ